METNEKEESTNNADNIYVNGVNGLDISKYKITKVEKNEDISNFEEIIYKVVLLGDPDVGKNFIIHSLIESEPIKEAYKATIGFDIFNYSAHVNEKLITMQIWDTCGLIDFSACTPKLYNNVSIAIIVYNITKKKTFENIQNWYNLIKLNSSDETIIFIVGNKKVSEYYREVTIEEGIQYTKDNGFKFFIENSGNERQIARIIIEQALVQLYELYNNYKKNCKEEEEEEEPRIDFVKRKDTFKLNNRGKNKNKKHKCCS